MQHASAHVQIMREMCQSRAAMAEKLLQEKQYVLKTHPFRLVNDVFYGAFVILDPSGTMLIESQGPMVGVENLAAFPETDHQMLYEYGVHGILLHHLDREKLTQYEQTQHCLF